MNIKPIFFIVLLLGIIKNSNPCCDGKSLDLTTSIKDNIMIPFVIPFCITYTLIQSAQMVAKNYFKVTKKINFYLAVSVTISIMLGYCCLLSIKPEKLPTMLKHILCTDFWHIYATGTSIVSYVVYVFFVEQYYNCKK